MGLWDFVKNAGKALRHRCGRGRDAGGAHRRRGALKKEIGDLGLKAEGLDVKVERRHGQGQRPRAEPGGAGEDHPRRRQRRRRRKVEERSRRRSPAETPVFHTVVKGDTLWKIAERTLGKGARYKEIFEANRPMLSDPDKIYPGQVLRIPAE